MASHAAALNPRSDYLLLGFTHGAQQIGHDARWPPTLWRRLIGWQGNAGTLGGSRAAHCAACWPTTCSATRSFAFPGSFRPSIGCPPSPTLPTRCRSAKMPAAKTITLAECQGECILLLPLPAFSGRVPQLAPGPWKPGSRPVSRRLIQLRCRRGPGSRRHAHGAPAHQRSPMAAGGGQWGVRPLPPPAAAAPAACSLPCSPLRPAPLTDRSAAHPTRRAHV